MIDNMINLGTIMRRIDLFGFRFLIMVYVITSGLHDLGQVNSFLFKLVLARLLSIKTGWLEARRGSLSIIVTSQISHVTGSL